MHANPINRDRTQKGSWNRRKKDETLPSKRLENLKRIRAAPGVFSAISKIYLMEE